MKPFAALITAITAALLVGCDTVSGTERTVTVSRLPAPSVVIAALHSVPGVQHVTPREVPNSTEWSLYVGTVHRPAYSQFTFGTDTIWGTVETKHDSRGISSLHLYSFWLNGTPSKAEFDRARSLLDAAYISLRRFAPNLPLPAAVKETLIRILPHDRTA